MKPALVFALAVSLFFPACSAQSEPHNPQKLTRPAALAMLVKRYYFPVIPGHIRLCVGHAIDFNTGRHLQNSSEVADYLFFLNTLAEIGVLKRDPSKDVPDTPGAMSGTVIAGADCFSPTNPALHASGQGIFFEADFTAATERFVEVTGIQQISPTQAIVHARVRREDTPILRSLGRAYNRMSNTTPGNHLNWENFIKDAAGNNPNLFFPMGDREQAFDFTKYDDGWRPGN